MSSFYNSSSAKVVPECLSSPSHALIITKKAMDSSADLLIIKPLDNPPSSPTLLPDNDLIKPMILTFDKKIRLNPSLISTTTDDNQVISSSASEGALWPQRTELDDLPSSPSHADAVKQAIHDPAYPLPKLNDRPSSQSDKTQLPAYLLNVDRPPASPHSFKQVTREPGYQTEQANRPSSPPAIYKPRMQVIREADYQAQHKAEEGVDKPKMQMISEASATAAYQAGDDKQLEMKERGRLSRVVEESESFSRREFGGNVLNYMSTHSSANHAANLSNYNSYIQSNLSHKHPSYHHNNHSNFSYSHSSYQPASAANFINSKSAPAGFAVRNRSTFALFRRGTSEGGKLPAGGRVVYRRPKSRKPKSLGHTLLWPLLKIRNGYVGCMMGIEGSGDLSGMAQGGTYATRARYFADIPLSKTDSRNHG